MVANYRQQQTTTEMTYTAPAMRDMKLIDEKIKSYLKYVWEQEKEKIMEMEFGENETYNSLGDYLDDKFKQDAFNNWDKGYDFYEWLDLHPSTLHYSTHYKLITYIVEYYESNYGDTGAFDTKKISFGYVMKHYAYVKGAEMSIEEMCDILGL